MNCLKCKKQDTKVIDSRVSTNCVKRRRECIYCHFRFTTYEHPEPIDLKVIKRNKELEDYHREKIISGLQKAFPKREITDEKIEQIVCAVEKTIFHKYPHKIKSATIGKIILNKLKKVDKIAYLRFASVYKNFSDVKSFYKEAQKINK